LPIAVKAKDLVVDIKKKHLKVQVNVLQGLNKVVESSKKLATFLRLKGIHQ
jgi:hypothetical protein